MIGLATVSVLALALSAPDVSVNGRVVDENNARIADARITASNSTAKWETQSDPTGAFKLTLPGPGEYFFQVSREGFYEVKDSPIRVEAGQEITLIMNGVRDVFQSVRVSGDPSPVDLTHPQSEERLSGTEINNVPYPGTHSLTRAMKLMPGVVEDVTGGLHFSGASKNQVLYTLNGFNISNPISGGYQTMLGGEGIRSIAYGRAGNSPATGRGSAGLLAIQTASGTDQFRFTGTNLLPSLDFQGQHHTGSWFPRAGFSGPLKRGRAWFSDNLQIEHNQSLVNDLPRGQNVRSGWAGGNMVHTQVNLSPSNILFVDFLLNLRNLHREGLGPLDPASTTLEVRSSDYFTSVKDQAYLGHGAWLEFGYAHHQLTTRQIPQGQQPYIFSPDGRQGNYFLSSTQTASRDELLVNGHGPVFQLAGRHQIQAGLDTEHLVYNGDFQRTGYNVVGATGQLLTKTLFQGPGLFKLSDTQMSGYLLDEWRVRKNFLLNAGVRYDWDQRVAASVWAPRLSFSWSPFQSGRASERTRITGGYGVSCDAPSLGVLGRGWDQGAVTVHYNPDGSIAGPPAVTTFGLGPRRLRLPCAANWTAGWNQQIGARLYGSVNYLRRRQNNGFTYLNVVDPNTAPFEFPLSNSVLDGNYQLTNFRRDSYDHLEISMRQSFSGQFEWMASYTRSRALSNALLDLYSLVPVQVIPSFAPMPWDAPHRAVAWAYAPLPWKDWAVATLLDARTGFPFSVRNQGGTITGGVGGRRYPLSFDLNVHLERKFVLRGYRFAVRGGFNNITNHANPTAVHNVLESQRFLQFFGNEGRHFVVRLRFFGRTT